MKNKETNIYIENIKDKLKFEIKKKILIIISIN